MIKVTYIAPIGLRFCLRESFDEIYNLSPSDGPKRRKFKKNKRIVKVILRFLAFLMIFREVCV